MTGSRGSQGTLDDSLKVHLELLYETYDANFLDTDPLSIVHDYSDETDIEVSAFVASTLAYGNVTTILASVRRVLDALGDHPRDGLTPKGLRRSRARLASFRHRWTSGKDICDAMSSISYAIGKYGSLQGLFLDAEASTWKERLCAFQTRLFEKAAQGSDRRSLKFLFATPSPGSASKRLCLFLRWMVRRDDGLDLGLWTEVSPSDLVIPLDTHIARIARAIGLTELTTNGWAAAVSITDTLRILDPGDPIKYDFALCRLGILDHCPRHRDEVRCQSCRIQSICRL